ncbi:MULTISPECIES: prepilin peptidase [Mycobacteriaceae]|uniref:Prepilin peptidase n=2 Tax=Mycolicibacterium mucogenicum DSM 44124 TaxID=1226753 RepID=A0A8E4RC82_MYCMU|nr:MULTISPECIES: A24 family peptidase [Mycobacteriaceae]QPG71772.1 prepilin peptidase [Mycolicibacterium mucogenicum DSM 44124]SEB20795.1 leader peptidase (prepilin peptidase) / N-methyltransferase [Mycobacterium sp. 283mftsu]
MGAGLAIGLWMIALCAYDLRERRLPNWLTLPGAAVILLAAVILGRGLPALAGAAALFALYLLIHLLSPDAMGGGDVKLALGLGALTGMCGADVWVLAAIGAPLLTAGYAVLVLLRRNGRTVPHGPSMCLASAAAVALGTFASP